MMSRKSDTRPRKGDSLMRIAAVSNLIPKGPSSALKPFMTKPSAFRFWAPAVLAGAVAFAPLASPGFAQNQSAATQAVLDKAHALEVRGSDGPCHAVLATGAAGRSEQHRGPGRGWPERPSRAVIRNSQILMWSVCALSILTTLGSREWNRWARSPTIMFSCNRLASWLSKGNTLSQ